MIKFITKIVLIIALGTVSFYAKAQAGYDYAQYDIGTAVGVNIAAMADVNTFTTTPSVHFNFNYNQSPFVNYVFELQVGRLEGGTLASSSGRVFENHFTAFSFRGQLQAGEFIDYSSSPFMNVMKNWYVSTGIGYMSNHIVHKTDDKRGLQYTPAGDDNAQVPFLPARIGYEFKLYNQYSQPSVKIDLGFQYNFLFGDNIDGYTSAGNNDAYAQFTIGVKFAIGGVTSYRKQIHY